MQENTHNTGILIRPPSPTDYIAGEETGIVYREITNDWTPYLPDDEKQRLKKFDTSACVTFSAFNTIEAQINWLIRHELRKEQIDKLEELGFLDGNYRINISDRFTAKMSGTTKQGNYQTNVADSIRKDGFVPEKDWKADDKMTWDEYYAEIPQEIKDKAKKVLEIFEIKYEWVIKPDYQPHIKDILEFHVKQAPCQIAAPICPKWSAPDVVPTCPLINPVHATTIYGVKDRFFNLDHYVPFRKQLALDYPIPWSLKIVVTPRKEKAEITKPKHYFAYNLTYGMMKSQQPEYIGRDIIALQNILKYEGFLSKDVLSTGNFVNRTAEALYKWQTFHKVAPQAELDALQGRKAGRKTIAKLNELYF